MTFVHATTAGRFSPGRLFRPESVAVIGAATEVGGPVMTNLLQGGFKGAVLPVDKRRKAISGVLAYPDIPSLPVTPDLAVIVPENGVVGPMLEALAAKGTFAAIVIGGASDVKEAVRTTRVRVIGPGSFGLCVPALGLNA